MTAKDPKSFDSSTFVEINSEDSDYELDFVNGIQQDTAATKRRDKEESESSDGLSGNISDGVATYVWQEGQQRARKALSLYANIDVLRPYFDVEPQEVRKSLLASLIPRIQLSSNTQVPVPVELYGPSMLVLTLIAMLLYQMKSQSISVQEGTLMGTAFGTCFGYWFGMSGLLLLTAYICNTHITMLQLLNLLGYGLFGHCIVLFLTATFHPTHSHVFFYCMWLIFGGLASFKIASVLMSRTTRSTPKLVMCAIVVSLHLLFLLYLHFAYHHVVEDLSAAFDKAPHHLATVQIMNDVDSPISKVDFSNVVRGEGNNQSLIINVLKKGKRSVLKVTTLSLSNAVDQMARAVIPSHVNNTLVTFAAEKLLSHAMKTS